MERRRFTRINCHCPAELKFPDGASCTGVVTDISFSGVYFDADRPLGIGPGLDYLDQEIWLVLQLVEESVGVIVAAKGLLQGTVGFAAPLHFTYMPEDAYLILRKYLLSSSDSPHQMCREITGSAEPPSHNNWMRKVRETCDQLRPVP